MSRVSEYMDEDYERAVEEANKTTEWIGRQGYHTNDKFCLAMGVLLCSIIGIGVVALAIHFYPHIKDWDSPYVYVAFVLVYLYFYICYRKSQE
ncbi:hypothetical protein BC940DRAFT_287295 [Gongronella butleri]|nr:hypothetical protein BC940DRAFT_287295 [Gongronella butleri]